MQRSLTSRVRAAHYVDEFPLARQRLRRAAAVINPRALQPVDPGSVQSPPLHASCDHEGVARNLIPIDQLNNSVRIFYSDANHFLRRQNLYSKPLGLHNGNRSAMPTLASFGNTIHFAWQSEGTLRYRFLTHDGDNWRWSDEIDTGMKCMMWAML